MNQGKIVEYIDKGKLICALCIQDKGNRLHLVTSSNREVNLSVARVLLTSNNSLLLNGPREDQLIRLKRIEETRETLMREVEVQELWELIYEENQQFDYKYLAQLCFGEDVTDDQISALVRALFEDRTYFKMKEGSFVPNTRERVEEIIRNREEEARRQKILNQGSAWLRGLLEKRDVPEPESKDFIIETLKDLVLYGDEAPEFRYGKELLQKAGINDVQRSRDILIKLGVWEKDENLDLLRLEVRTDFQQGLLVRAETLPRGIPDAAEREDLTHLHVFTIDGEETRDFDDALSLETIDRGYRLGIHIADVAGVIPPGSELDQEAAQRGSSLYLPRRQIPMFPQVLSQDSLSLLKGTERAAISLLAEFDHEGYLLHHRFVLSVIRVRSRLTYEEVNKELLNEHPFEPLNRLSGLLRRIRVDQGAMILSLPEIVLDIGEHGGVNVSLVDQDTPSRMIVAELMIFYNWMLARHCSDHLVPILYRSQDEPSDKLSMGEEGYAYYVFKQRRKLNPLMIDVIPKPHTGLGLDVYTQASSPIRRYLDLVVQRQIRNVLLDRPPVYDEETLEKIRLSVLPLLRDIARLKQRRIRYWVLKHLKTQKEKIFPAVVLDTFKSKCRVLMSDLLILGEMKPEQGTLLVEGQRIQVSVQKADPWNDQLVLKLESVVRAD